MKILLDCVFNSITWINYTWNFNNNSSNLKGTTFVECKSGYGLEWETEYKLLRVLTKAKRELKSIGISNTYLGGHAVPK